MHRVALNIMDLPGDHFDSMVDWLDQPLHRGLLHDVTWGIQGVMIAHFTCPDTALLFKLTWR